MWNRESLALESGILRKEAGFCYELEFGIHVPVTKNPQSSICNQKPTAWESWIILHGANQQATFSLDRQHGHPRD